DRRTVRLGSPPGRPGSGPFSLPAFMVNRERCGHEPSEKRLSGAHALTDSIRQHAAAENIAPVIQRARHDELFVTAVNSLKQDVSAKRRGKQAVSPNGWGPLAGRVRFRAPTHG